MWRIGKKTFVAAFLIALFGVNQALAALVFEDGQSHVIDQPSDSIIVFNSPAPDNLPTTVTIATGGTITTITPGPVNAAVSVSGTSAIELAGGSVAISEAGTRGIEVSSDSQVRVTSGAITMTGANSTGIALGENARAEILGGTITATSIGLNGFGHTQSVIRGGTIRGDGGAFDIRVNSQLHVYGGLLGDMDGGVDLTVAGGEAHFYGSAFQLNGVPIAQGLIAGPGNFVGRLTGTLDSGESLDIGIRVEDLGPGNNFPALIYVHVPEPSSLLLFGFAALAFVASRRGPAASSLRSSAR